MEPLPFAEAEQFGREMLANGGMEELRGWFRLSHTKLAGHLQTNTTTVRAWLEIPSVSEKMQSTTAERVGQFAHQLTLKARELYDSGVRVTDLYPLWLLAGELGCSVASPKFVRLCQTDQLTCYDTGVLGVYIPTVQAEQLKSKVLV